jgi:hypothetical protein
LVEWSYLSGAIILKVECSQTGLLCLRNQSLDIFLKKPLADEIGVRGFSKLGKSSFFVRAVLPSLA